MDQDEVGVDELAKKKKNKTKQNKKRTRPISSHLDRTNLVNIGFITWCPGKLLMLDTAGSPERARWLHPARVVNRIARFNPSCPLEELAI